jgi:hypothetical protein
VALRAELLAYENARGALSSYDIREPYENAVAVETVSLGIAVSLLGDLDWYLRRLARDALVREPSVHPAEWLSRDLATAIRDGEVDPEETGTHLKVYGVVQDGGDTDESSTESVEGTAGESDGIDSGNDGNDGSVGLSRQPRGRLVEPMYVTRTGESIPEYDLRAVDDTLVVRVTPAEFG